MNVFFHVISLFVGIMIGVFICYMVLRYFANRRLESSENKAKEILDSAKAEAEEIKKSLYEDKKQHHKEIEKAERGIKDRRADLNSLERRLQQKENNLEKKENNLEKKEDNLLKKENNLVKKENNLERKIAQAEKNEQEVNSYRKKLEQDTLSLETEKDNLQKRIEEIASLTKEEAREVVIDLVKDEAEKSAFSLAHKIEEESRIVAERKAKYHIINAMNRIAPEIVGDIVVSTVSLPNDKMKGRIIGREGRNIRTLENLIGVDIIIDDTPEAVVISCFDPIRREIAKLTLENLILDGRIHPARIEEVLEKVKKELDERMLEDGEKACMELGIAGMHIELQRLLGKLKFRTSYGQNMYYHSIEVARIAGLIASELKLNVENSKRAGLLHDIGKAVSTENPGPHAIIGGDLLKQYGENETIINAVAAHHNDIETKSLEAVIVQVADAISASRPGARRDSFDSYVKRLENLEKIAKVYEGVEKAYAIQAGREIRIIVNHEKVDDSSANKIAREIANKIESEMKYPGQIKVTLIRETRIIEYAR